MPVRAPVTRWDPTEIAAPFSRWRMGLAVLMTTCLVVGSILSVRLIEVGGFRVTAGTIIFPVTFACIVITAEVYGLLAALDLALFGAMALSITAAAFEITDRLPPPPRLGDNQAAFHQLFGTTVGPVLFVLVAYLVSAAAGLGLLYIIAKKTRGAWLWVRIGFVPMMCQIMTTIIALPLIYGYLGPQNTVTLVIARCLYAVTYAWATMPLLYAFVLYLRWHERPALLELLRLTGQLRERMHDGPHTPGP